MYLWLNDYVAIFHITDFMGRQSVTDQCTANLWSFHNYGCNHISNQWIMWFCISCDLTLVMFSGCDKVSVYTKVSFCGSGKFG